MSSRLHKVTGQSTVVETVVSPPPPYTPEPTTPSIAKPVLIPIRRVTETPQADADPITSMTGLYVVPCSPGPRGERRFSIWRENTQISPCG